MQSTPPLHWQPGLAALLWLSAKADGVYCPLLFSFFWSASPHLSICHALLDNQRFVLGPTLSIVPVGVSAQEPASVSGPAVWQGASGPMPAPYDGERRVRREGQKGPRGFLRVDL